MVKTMATGGNTQRLVKKTLDNAELKDQLRTANATIKVQSDMIGAKDSYIGEIEKELQQYKELGGVVIAVNDSNYVTDYVELPPYNEYIEVSAIPLQNISGLVKTVLYGKFKFIKQVGNTIVIDEAQYKKYLGGL